MVSPFPKILRIREEDYWIHAVSVPTVVALMMAMYAVTPPFRIPSIIVGLFGLWFGTIKIKSGYGVRRAWLHVLLTLSIAGLFAILLHYLTN